MCSMRGAGTAMPMGDCRHVNQYRRAPLASMATFSEVPLFSSGRGVGLIAFFAIYDFVVFGVPDVLAAWSSGRKAEVFPHERIHILY